MTDSPITGDSTIAQWLAHPIGHDLIIQLLGGPEASEATVPQVRNLPLNTLVELSQGQLTQETVDDVVRAANGGEMPQASVQPQAVNRFAGKTVIVTGAASGIGRATAERLIAEGGRVVAVDVSKDNLDALVDVAPEGAVVAVVGDITDPGDIARIVDAAGERIDGLANVAGIMDGMLPLHEVGDDVWARVLAVNVTGSFLLSKAVVARMLETGGGAVVNVTSEAALRGNAAGTAYTVSKHAVVGLTRSAAFLYGPSGIRTNAVAPGPTATAISGDFRSEFAEGRLGPFLAMLPPVTTAQRIAASITWLLSDDSDNVNGQVLASDGGWSVQ